MLDSRPQVPLRFRLLNTAAKYSLAGKLPVARLDEETLNKAAIEETGLTDFGDPYYREGLLTLIESAEKDANLHFIGRTSMHGMVAMYLANRLLLAEARKRKPEVFKRELIPPIIILGPPRSGTTLLHRMLAADPAHRGVPLWQMVRPLPTGTPDRRREFIEEAMNFARKLNSNLDGIHYTRADEPEECMVLLGTTFASVLFFAAAPTYSYADWYLSRDHPKAYQEYRLLLQVLQAVEPGRRLTLKAPAHTGALAVLFETIPEALFIQTHRDPVAVCGSTLSMIYAWYRMVTNEIDIPRMAETFMRALEKAATASLTFRETNPGIIYDVFYDKLVADPIGTVKGVYDHFGLAWSDSYEEQLKVYVRDNQQGKHGEHHYSLEDFGLTDETVAKRSAEYSREFGLVR